MPETYCGKNCEECTQKEILNCPGCKSGPGKRYGGDCDLAKCVQSKGHATCDTCGFHESCGTLRSRDRMPQQRIARIEAEKARQAALAKRAPVLGRWIWILFWLVVPSTIGEFMSNDTMAQILPALYLPGKLLGALCTLAYGAILLKLSAEEDRYKTAGICCLVAGLASTIAAFVGDAPWILLITLPAAIVSLVGQYNEYMAHSAVLAGVDYALSGKWETLWKWHIGLLAAMFGCILLAVIIPILGTLVLIAAAIGILVVSILKLVYLYQTAQIFRAYAFGA